MFLNDSHLRFRWSQRCCYPSCLLPSFPVHRSRFPAHESIAVNGAVWPFKAFIVMSGTKGHNPSVRPLAPPSRAVYGVSLWILPSVVVSLWCGVTLPPGARCPAWGSGVPPTVGRGRRWVLPHYRGAPMVGCPLQWGWVDSGCFPTIGVAGLWVLVDSGLVPTIKALSDVALTFK